MLLTVSTTHRPATDLGYLLHKHPERVQEFRQSFGIATVFYPEATEERCTVALLLEIDPVRLARSCARNSPDFSLAQYVNDRSHAVTPDHRFEWDRAQFTESSQRLAATYGYAVERRGIGDHDDALGTPTQLAVFTRES